MRRKNRASKHAAELPDCTLNRGKMSVSCCIRQASVSIILVAESHHTPHSSWWTPKVTSEADHLRKGEMAHSNFELVPVVRSFAQHASKPVTGPCRHVQVTIYGTNSTGNLPCPSITLEVELFSGTTINAVYALSIQLTFATLQKFHTDDRVTGRQINCRAVRKVVVHVENAGESMDRILTNKISITHASVVKHG